MCWEGKCRSFCSKWWKWTRNVLRFLSWCNVFAKWAEERKEEERHDDMRERNELTQRYEERTCLLGCWCVTSFPETLGMGGTEIVKKSWKQPRFKCQRLTPDRGNCKSLLVTARSCSCRMESNLRLPFSFSVSFQETISSRNCWKRSLLSQTHLSAVCQLFWKSQQKAWNMHLHQSCSRASTPSRVPCLQLRNSRWFSCVLQARVWVLQTPTPF